MLKIRFKIPRFFYPITFSFIVIVGFGQLASSYLQFRMTAKEAEKYFEGLPQKPEIRHYQVGSRTLNYADVGTHAQNAVVFVHGAPGAWSAFADFLKDDILLQHARLIAIDRPGYGFSNYGEPVVSLEEQCQLIAPLLDSISRYHTILVGHSLGGPVVARLAMDYPDRVDALMLVAPSIDPELEEKNWYREVGRSFIGQSILPGSIWSTNEEIYFLEGELNLMLPLWKNIQIPTLVIQGMEDNLVPMENAAFARNMVDGEFLEVWLEEDVDHFIPWNRPDLIRKGVLKLMASNPKSD